MHKQTKAARIPRAVKDAVHERDGGQCLICESPHGLPEAHFIRRSRGGLGVEENILTLCRKCHGEYDSRRQDESDEWYCFFKAYLMHHYPGWDEKNLIYDKWRVESA